MPSGPVLPEPGWIEVADRASLTYTTTDNVGLIEGDPDYWNDKLPEEYGVGSIIKVNAGNGSLILLVTDVTTVPGTPPSRDVTVAPLVTTATDAPYASFSYIAFHGMKWAGSGPLSGLDNKDPRQPVRH